VSKSWKEWSRKLVALMVLMALSLNAIGCGNIHAGPNSPPIDDTQGGYSQSGGYQQAPAQPRQTGMSNKQKMVMLAGAAALYYMYKKNQNSQQGPQYYLSKNGRVYYRDAQGRAHWVTPPREGIYVPAQEAYQYREFQGYNNNPHGRDLRSVAAGEY
jgi:hypothetical protein